MAFFLRKLAGLVLSPSVFFVGTLVLGALLYFSKRGRAMGRRLLFAGNFTNFNLSKLGRL